METEALTNYIDDLPELSEAITALQVTASREDEAAMASADTDVRRVSSYLRRALLWGHTGGTTGSQGSAGRRVLVPQDWSGWLLVMPCS